MKIVIIRHAEPDYSIDGLTEKGKLEAALLAQRLCKMGCDSFYCSTMGRARLTVAPALHILGKECDYCQWLQEFDWGDNKISLPYLDRKKGCWDILPSFIKERGELYSPEGWRSVDFIKDSTVPERYDTVCRLFDGVLNENGYKRDGLCYSVHGSNHKTLVFTCHFGVGAVLISHLMNCSPYSIWQNTVLLPSSVTVFNSEEREEDIAHFRASCIGDTSHLYAKGEEPSFAARFCECYLDDTRH